MQTFSLVKGVKRYATMIAVVTAGVGIFATSALAATTVVTTSLPNARVGAAYSQALTATGGTAPYTWNVTGGQLPVGLALDGTTGVISGTPEYNLTYLFTVKARDAMGDTAAKSLTIQVDPATPPVLTPGTPIGTIDPTISTSAVLPNGTVGSAYSVDLTGSGGVAPYRWSVVAESPLPPGLSLVAGSSGQLRGTPTAAGSYTTRIKINDVNDRSSVKTFTITINPPVTALTLTTTSVPVGTVGVGYSASLSGVGGAIPYSWNFASGTLPPGLTLLGNGMITGTPTAAGTFTAHIELFDATRAFTGGDLTFVVNPTPTTGGSTEVTNRLNILASLGISVNSLVKLPDDGNRFTQADSAVYYIGADGRRHAFPNDRVFFTWYGDFGGVRVISATSLASIPLGANVTYRPGVKMVKFMTDPKVYAVSSNRTLRWVATESAALSLYGSSWNRQIDDVSDAFYLDYNMGAQISTSADFSPAAVRAAAGIVSDTLPL